MSGKQGSCTPRPAIKHLHHLVLWSAKYRKTNGKKHQQMTQRGMESQQENRKEPTTDRAEVTGRKTRWKDLNLKETHVDKE